MFHQKDRGKSLAIASMFPYLGPALGPIVGGIVSQYVSWPWLFWVMSIFDAVVVDTTPAIEDPVPGPSRVVEERAPSEQTFISIDELPPLLPDRFHGCLRAQKLQILRASQCPSAAAPAASDEEPSTNEIASTQLKNLLAGTLSRGEGNSCLIMGPRGSGKSRVSHFARKPIEQHLKHIP